MKPTDLVLLLLPVPALLLVALAGGALLVRWGADRTGHGPASGRSQPEAVR
jgi:hypothetical protein